MSLLKMPSNNKAMLMQAFAVGIGLIVFAVVRKMIMNSGVLGSGSALEPTAGAEGEEEIHATDSVCMQEYGVECATACTENGGAWTATPDPDALGDGYCVGGNFSPVAPSPTRPILRERSVNPTGSTLVRKQAMKRFF
jgi:hypothetical protein